MESGYPVIREVVYVARQENWSFPLHKHEEAAELSLIIGGRRPERGSAAEAELAFCMRMRYIIIYQSCRKTGTPIFSSGGGT